MENDNRYLYGGLSGMQLEGDFFDLGEGIALRKTYAHIMAPYIIAFTPPDPQGNVPAPWKTAKGGPGFDITVEIRVPAEEHRGESLSARERLWWIAALLRLAQVATPTVPVISSHPFDVIAVPEIQPSLEPFEPTPVTVRKDQSSGDILTESILNWTKDKWVAGMRLLQANPGFRSAFVAFDAASLSGRRSSRMLALLGGLEQIFSPQSTARNYPVAALVASYLEAPGQSRHDLYRRITRLYDNPSAAAHPSAREMVLETHILMRQVLLKIIEENNVPTQEYLEARLFGCT